VNRVIKSGSSGFLRDASAASSASELLRELRTDEEAARGVIGKAQQQAEIIIRTARAEAENVQDAAREEGYRIGVTDGTQAAEELASRLESAIAEVARERASLLDSVEQEVLKLCVEAVEKIVRHEIKSDPRVVLRVIHACLRRVRDRNDVAVRVSPGEVELVKESREELLSAADGLDSFTIIDDRRITPGGCVVEAPSGDIDARVETQVDQVSKKLAETNSDGGLANSTGPEQVSSGDQSD